MPEFKPGQTHTFYICEIYDYNDEKYIRLSDGVKDTYRVKPYEYQLALDYQLPKQMECFVKSVNVWGLPLLVQSRKAAIEECFTETGEFYPFKVIAKEKDSNTDADFWMLNDAFGITHRFYPKEHSNCELGDIISLKFIGFEDKGRNKVYLNLQQDEPKTKTPVSLEIEGNEAPLESVFGQENEQCEFKSSIAFPAGGTEPDIDKQISVIMRTIAGLQNNQGGVLYLGVNDAGNPIGIQHDFPYLNQSETDPYNYTENQDGYELKLRNSITYYLGSSSNSHLSFKFDKNNGYDYVEVTIQENLRPVFMQGNKLYQRAGNMTQILRGDEITWFIEERILKRHNALSEKIGATKHENIEIESDEVEELKTVEVAKVEQAKLEKPNYSLFASDDKIWRYVSWYKNGDWSYQKSKSKENDVIAETAIMSSCKHDSLCIAYDNGRVNIVKPYDLIRPMGRNGRRYKKEKHRYQNGWNTGASIINSFCVKDTDLIAFASEKEDGTKWAKIHRVGDISKHGYIGAQGNVLVNEKLEAKPMAVVPLSISYHHLLSGLILNKNQTSGYLGFNFKNQALKKSINLLLDVLKE